ncbi:methylated-DNA--[protein]-cysteine S-methyltransferase [Wenxinia saemankumensis]|uniref:Methylated-DNA-[protein]-cysteine S-methyltransferase n=1 Tax=Wenxinia saemankumensis TaxID=1447782 RepID=A0A1M6CD17_9RHOB|nr:methylated-DNA--[protein]-cysteine S-methyltransferase [Wenxinia saemankumensis]SHI58896.1 methylated-DNA-[protein]-cysteine S-methyltransferase [Wenxinia saemankumensis]
MVSRPAGLKAALDTPTGPFWIEARAGAIVAAGWGPVLRPARGVDLLQRACVQVTAYWAGLLQDFDLPLDPGGTGLAARVWAEMRAIPYGRTRSYGEIGAALGVPPQAVGQACGANPLPLLIPCHRVTGTGRLGGFSGALGPETKAALLRHEGALLI